MLKKLSVFISFVFAVGIFCGCSSNVEIREDEAVNTSVGIKSGGTSYKVCLEDDEVVLYNISGGEKAIVKKRKALPLRKKDEEELMKGLYADDMEEALGIFEDFAN